MDILLIQHIILISLFKVGKMKKVSAFTNNYIKTEK